MRSTEKESLRIQKLAFDLLEEIVTEPLLYAGADLLEGRRVRKLLLTANALHGIIIQSIQVGHEKRALRYLLALKKVSEEIASSRSDVQEVLEKRFRAFHGL